ncbi:MAG: NUDIX domain-containing protein [Phycisphaeraceae bacterium]
MTTGPIVRDAARVILLDPRDRILLFHCRDPADDRCFWVMPGGGLEAGESFHDAAQRELYEETGLTGLTLSPSLWHRTHAFSYRRQQYVQRERFFLARTLDVEIRSMVDDQEMNDQLGHRWWSDQALAHSAETFAPRRLPQLLPPLLAGELPATPIDVGV